MVQSGKGHLEVSEVCREVAGPAVEHAREWRLDCWVSAVSAVLFLFIKRRAEATGGLMHLPHASNTQSPQDKAARHPKQ